MLPLLLVQHPQRQVQRWGGPGRSMRQEYRLQERQWPKRWWLSKSNCIFLPAFKAHGPMRPWNGPHAKAFRKAEAKLQPTKRIATEEEASPGHHRQIAWEVDCFGTSTWVTTQDTSTWVTTQNETSSFSSSLWAHQGRPRRRRCPQSLAQRLQSQRLRILQTRHPRPPRLPRSRRLRRRHPQALPQQLTFSSCPIDPVRLKTCF